MDLLCATCSTIFVIPSSEDWWIFLYQLKTVSLSGHLHLEELCGDCPLRLSLEMTMRYDAMELDSWFQWVKTGYWRWRGQMIALQNQWSGTNKEGRKDRKLIRMLKSSLKLLLTSFSKTKKIARKIKNKRMKINTWESIPFLIEFWRKAVYILCSHLLGWKGLVGSCHPSGRLSASRR